MSLWESAHDHADMRNQGDPRRHLIRLSEFGRVGQVAELPGRAAVAGLVNVRKTAAGGTCPALQRAAEFRPANVRREAVQLSPGHTSIVACKKVRAALVPGIGEQPAVRRIDETEAKA